jgi:OOP family OmpA-OmpF porin
LISQPFVELIAKQAEQLSHNPDTCVFLAGYSDSIGPAQYNQQLSLERVEEVAKMMIYLGVDPEQIIKVGYGEQFGETVSEFAKQRRVDWYLTDELGKL